jgi:2-amino-4-hydroxy-6-hydroxymethyldihydropteridine diphosphokinase
VPKTAEVFVSVGSNVEPAQNLRWGLEQMARRFGALRVSPIFRNAPFGFEGDDFYNLVVGFDTAETPRAVSEALDAMENQCGRNRSGERYGPRTLDLDLLLHGSTVMDEPGLVLPRPDLLRYAFMLGPLAALAGDRRHPRTGEAFATLWSRFDQASHPLVEVRLPGVPEARYEA